ncbi:MAG: HAMP domain-containing histidine kinase [Ruminococcaceae bacterium]|nr:HAMP domain-containing histidine kinase [Oscillospiraceae bacterium]
MEQIKQMLELMGRPAFCAEEGVIRAANNAALSYQIAPGDPVEPLIAAGREDYAEFQDGCLYLTLELCGQSKGASVTNVSGRHIFTLDADQTDAEQQLLALAAMELREPLGNVMALFDQLRAESEDDPTHARINRELYRLLRLVGNMTPQNAPRLEMLELNALLHELWDKALPACEALGFRFTFTPHPAPVYTLVDAAMLTRAIHNLLSNSLKFAATGGTIELKLALRNRRCIITLWDSGDNGSQTLASFTRFRREPGIEDGRSGMGLGLSLVRETAAAHRGSAMIVQPPEGGTLVQLSIPQRQDTQNVRSPRKSLSYCGERDAMRVELSDVLPPEFYQD